MAKKEHIVDVKERILDAAHELFIKNGYNGTSVRDIVALSDTNVAHIKYYFQSKYNLFEIVFEEAFDILVKRVFSVLNSDMSFFGMVEAWINTYYEILVQSPQIPNFVINEISHNPTRLTNIIKRRDSEKVFSHIAGIIEKEVEKGTIKDTLPIDFVLNVMSLCIFPFIIGGLATKVANISMAEYNELLRRHKSYVVNFVLDALRP